MHAAAVSTYRGDHAPAAAVILVVVVALVEEQ